MRGKHEYGNDTGEYDGITPAHAGKTSSGLPQATLRRDHPRACGENRSLPLKQKSIPGSPPRMRGKLDRRLYRCLKVRITPAHAGKTGRSAWHFTAARDHPRACGENSLELAPKAFIVGSPPRMRGKLHVLQRLHTRAGITPAHAGKTSEESTFARRHRDHPRACGENGLPVLLSSCELGSPPRMRGKRKAGIPFLRRAGITPAHAGKTFLILLVTSEVGDHPRACGENLRSIW